MIAPDNLSRRPAATPPHQAIRLGDCLAPGLHGKFWQSVRQRDDWALLALLRDRATNRHLVSACTHLFWDPKYPDVKVSSITSCLLLQSLLQSLLQRWIGGCLRGARNVDLVWKRACM